jgi:DNA-binding MurR/RpiR family transcriptional regulator
MRFAERVQLYEYKLNDTDDQIVEFIMQNKQEVADMSIQCLARRLFTVPNTISRFCKKLGYEGYAEFKTRLKEELRDQAEEEEDSLSYRIRKTLQLVDQERIALVAKRMAAARHVIFFGVGDSAPFCEMMVRHLKVVGKPSSFYLHRHEIIDEIERAGGKDDLLFLISLSGETPLVLEIAERGKRKGMKQVSLTHFHRNPLQELADMHLYCYSPKKVLHGRNISDRTPLMIVLQMLSETFWTLAGECV